ncbi:MAG: DUF6580 family putative transport protein [Bacteroidia bacterium]
MKNIQPKIGIVISAIAIAAFFRLIPHWPNFTPLAAIALMGGSLFSKKWMSIIVPLLALVVSDALTVLLINYKYITLGEYFSSSGTALIYFSMLVMIGIGYLIREKRSFGHLAVAAGSSAIAFFVISNFGVWLNNSLPKTFYGLLATYEMGIPFFANNLAGNVFYTFLFFGILSRVNQTELQTAKINVK